MFRIFPGPDSFPQLAVNELQCDVTSLTPDFRNNNSWMNQIFQGVCADELKKRVQVALKERIADGVQTLTQSLNLLSSAAAAMHQNAGDSDDESEEQPKKESSSSSSSASDSEHLWDRQGVLSDDSDSDSHGAKSDEND